jgi:hypothetical protein
MFPAETAVVTQKGNHVQRNDVGVARWRALQLIRVTVVALLAVAFAATAMACSSKEPPEDTVSALGAAVGDAKLDDVDFDTLLSSYTSEGYRANTEEDQANYQLYLTAKAAISGLAATDENIEVKSDVSGDKATVSFAFATPEGLFAVADLSKIDVALVYTESPENPWRIEKIVLGR